MRIENLRFEKKEGKARLSSTVIWEDCARPAEKLFFETHESYAERLSLSPHAFLVACILPAFHYGEERIFVEEEVCPQLLDGLLIATRWLRHWHPWYKADRKLVRIEARKIEFVPHHGEKDRAGSLFSGGIDSLATLRFNRLNYPLKHPLSIRDCLLIYGMNIESDNRLETFHETFSSLLDVTQDTNATLIPVYTNIRDLCDDAHFFKYEFHGAILAAVGHAFSQQISTLFLPSSTDLIKLALPWGSHPLLDPNYSSYNLSIHHDRIELSRFEKTKLVAEWEAALQNIKVCEPNWPGTNCGRCEKCIWTMTALLILGVLHKTRAFPSDDVSEDAFEMVRLDPENSEGAERYGDLLAPLQEIGRYDLVKGVMRVIERRRKGAMREGYLSPDWRTRCWKFDQKYTCGVLSRLKGLVIS